MAEEVERLKKEIEDLRSQISSMHKDASREEELKTLARLSAILNSTLDPREVQKRAMESATELMKAEVGSLLLVDEKRNELYFEVALGEKGAKVKEIRLKMGEGIAGWVAQNGEPLVIDDVTKDPRFSGKADEKSKFATKNMICVPVMIKEKIIGVLQAINKLEGMFSSKDLELFQMLANQEMDWLKLSAILHDIGKIGVEDRVLRKQGSLNDEEFALMKAHPRMGAEIMEYVEKLKNIIPGMKHHHERFDGKGYPDGLKDGEIPLIARIISVSDTFDAMTSDRPYRKGLSEETAINELQKYAGIQFDPDVVRAFIDAYKDGKIIYCRFKNCEEKKEGPKTL